MLRPALIFLPLISLAAVAGADEANISRTQNGAPGAVSQLITAQRGYEMALKSGDPILLLASVRLARGVVLRMPMSWERVTEGEAPADQPQGKEGAPDPASSTAVVIVQNFAGDDPNLQDYVYDLDAQLPNGRKETAIAADAVLGAGQQDSWRMPLSGAVPAEIGLIGDGDTSLSLTITDEAGLPVCTLPPSPEPGLCAFTPARNGFFTIVVENLGAAENSYRLLSN